MDFDLCADLRARNKLPDAHFMSQGLRRSGPAHALVCGFLLGLFVMAVIVAASVPAAISTGDLAGLWVTLGLTYVALAFGFWAFLNLNMTSLRIRMLRELLHSERGMARAELLGRYSPEEFLRRRIARLERSGDLALIRWALQPWIAETSLRGLLPEGFACRHLCRRRAQTGRLTLNGLSASRPSGDHRCHQARNLAPVPGGRVRPGPH